MKLLVALASLSIGADFDDSGSYGFTVSSLNSINERTGYQASYFSGDLTSYSAGLSFDLFDNKHYYIFGEVGYGELNDKGHVVSRIGMIAVTNFGFTGSISLRNHHISNNDESLVFGLGYTF